MRRSYYPLMILTLVALFLVGGCSQHYVDVYVNDDCSMVLHDNDPDVYIGELLFFPGDYVYFNSLRAKNITLNFPAGMFDTSGDVLLEPGKRILVKVTGKTGDSGTIGMSGDGCVLTPPEFKIGDGP